MREESRRGKKVCGCESENWREGLGLGIKF